MVQDSVYMGRLLSVFTRIVNAVPVTRDASKQTSNDQRSRTLQRVTIRQAHNNLQHDILIGPIPSQPKVCEIDNLVPNENVGGKTTAFGCS